MEILVVGLGYVGLTLSLYLADKNDELKITAYDINRVLIKRLKEKRVMYVEKGIIDIIEKRLQKNLKFVYKLDKKIYDVIFLCVGPQLQYKKISYENLQNAVKSIKNNIEKNTIIGLRKNVEVGFTTKLLVQRLRKDNPIVFVPERTNRESGLEELKYQPQLIGINDIKFKNEIKIKFKKLFDDIIITENLEEAELTILINHFHSYWLYNFGNILSLITTEFNFNTYKILQYANDRFTNRYDLYIDLRPEIHRPGYIGGKGLNLDLELLKKSLSKNSDIKQLIQRIQAINESIPKKIVNRCLKKLKKFNLNPKDINVCILGLGYKGTPPTTHFEFSLTGKVINLLQRKRIKNVFVHDPVVNKDKIEAFGVKYAEDIEEAVSNSNLLLLLSDNNYYKKGNLLKHLVEKLRKPKIIFDGYELMKNLKTKVNYITY